MSVHLHYLINLDDLTCALWLADMRPLSEMAGSRAVDRLSHFLGQDNPITLSAMFNPAPTYLHTGRHEDTYRLLSHVLRRSLHLYGPDHPDTLMVKNELGMNLCAQKNQLFEAQGMILEFVEARRRILGEEHAYTLWSTNDLSKIYCELKQPELAVAVLEEIVPIVDRTLGSRHVGMILTKSNLCRSYILCDRIREAREMSRDLLEVTTPEHSDWVHAKWGHAYILFLEGQKAGCKMCCTELLAHIETAKVFEPDNPRVISIADLLYRVYSKQGCQQEAEQLKAKNPLLFDKSTLHSVYPLPLRPLRRRVAGVFYN